MAVKASATVTLSCYRDTQSVTRYYKLQSSTALAPLKPKENPPRGWTDAEPSYSSGSTNTLYFCDLTEFSDGTWDYSTVSKSSSYEAAKEAYNKAQNAQDTANETQNALNEKIPMINGTQTSATYAWTGVAPFSELKDGQKITFWLPYNSYGGSSITLPYWKDSSGSTQQSTNSGVALNLTLSDGSTTGNVAVYYSGASRLTSHFSAGQAIELTYKKLTKIGSYYYTGWWINANYYSDTLDNRITYFAGKTGNKGIWANSMFMEDASGTYQNICTASDGTVTTSNRTTAKTKKANTNGFKMGSSIYYTSTSYNANANINGWGAVYSSCTLFDSRYAFNTELVANSLTPYKPIYLVGTVGEDGLYYLDEVWWTQTPNTTGKVYVLVGSCYDSTTSNCRITLYEDNRWYVYNGEKLQDYNVDAATEAAKTATNYMKFNNGLIIGNMTDEVLGNNVFIDSDSVDIRTGETILASYEGNKISLGKNSENSTIDFCDGSMLLTNKPSDMWGTRFEMLADRCVYINAPILVTIDSYYRNEDSNAHSYIDLGSAGYDATTDSFIPGGSVHISTSTDNETKSSSISLNKDSITLFSSGEGGEPFITLDGSDNKISLSLNPYIITSSGGSYRCILSNYFNGYSGLTHSDGSVSNWMRTTVNGLIPFESGGNSSSLGTSGWPFKNGYFKKLYSDDIYLANGTSVYGKNTSGSNVSMMGISSDNNLFIGAATEPQFDYTNIYAGSWIQLSANRTGDITSHVLQFFREQSSDKRTILRGATNGAIYLGTGSFRYNTAFFTNAITASDLKEKEVIEDFDFKIEDFIMGLNPIAYRRTGDNDTGRRIHMGFGAQDVSSLLKDISIGNMSLVQACVVDEETVTKTDESGTEYTEVQKVERPYYGEEIDDSKLSWGLNYNEFIAPLVLFVQKQQREIEKLKARCEVLEKGRTL